MVSTPAKKRREIRRARAAPIADAFFAWCQQESERVLNESPMAQAIGYALNQQVALRRFLDDGRLPLPSSPAARRHLLSERARSPTAAAFQGHSYCPLLAYGAPIIVGAPFLFSVRGPRIDSSQWTPCWLVGYWTYDLFQGRRMPRTISIESALASLSQDFVQKVVATIEQAVSDRIRTAVFAAMPSAGPKRGPGRPRKNPLAISSAALTLVRRKAPKQLCPVPGCKNPAAPVFGMVCAKHKEVPKAKIKQFRVKRKAQKAKGRRERAA
jgi:hypothetical protein